MSSRTFLSFLVVLSVSLHCHAVRVVTTNNLIVYYPSFSRVDLVCGRMPAASDKEVEFCCEAAFTGELLSAFKHGNIADNHISGGKMFRGYKCRANTGGFTWGRRGWRFMRKSGFPTEANGQKMGFCQLLIVLNGQQRPLAQKMRLNRNIYRALCEKDGQLCIIQSRRWMTYETFVHLLSSYHVTHALYLDMGAGWNYAWYRDAKGNRKEIFPESKASRSYPYRTNWITFYR